MRKIMKTVAVCAMTMAMTVAMGCIAFAGDGSTYKVVGAVGLVGEDWVPSATGTSTDAGQPGEMGLMTELTDNANVYSAKFNIATADDGKGNTKSDAVEVPVGYEFKILKDADDFAWTYQACLGNPSAAWGDNQTQFKLPADTTGEVTIYVDTTTGAVVVADKDGKAIDYLVRWKSRDEDPWDFTKVDKKEIEASKNASTGVQNADCQDVAKLNTELAEKIKVTPVKSEGSDEKVTKDSEETTTDAASEETTTAAKDDDSSSNTGVIVVVVIVVVVVIAGVAIVLSKKKKN